MRKSLEMFLRWVRDFARILFFNAQKWRGLMAAIDNLTVAVDNLTASVDALVAKPTTSEQAIQEQADRVAEQGRRVDEVVAK